MFCSGELEEKDIAPESRTVKSSIGAQSMELMAQHERLKLNIGSILGGEQRRKLGLHLSLLVSQLGLAD